MSEPIGVLRNYRSKMDMACEELAMRLGDLGVTKPMDDDELVQLAGRKLATLFEMLKAAGISEGILKAVMAE